MFPTVLRPLTNEEARPCLLHLVEDVKMALEELHSLGYAHLDVRLDNICLKKTQDGLMAVLIDFDFTMETEQAMEKRALVRRSNMYRIPDFKDESYSQNAEKFDWWQLGLLVAYCLTLHHCSVRPDYHKFEIPKELCQYEFVSTTNVNILCLNAYNSYKYRRKCTYSRYVLVWYIAILLMLRSYLFLDLYCMATPTRTAIDEVCRKTKRLPAAVENCQGSVV